jgi:hypothetical protein
MSFFFDLINNIGEVYKTDCINYDNSLLSRLFATYDLWPIFLTFAIIGLTAEHKEVFFFIVLFGTFFDGLLNWGWRALIGKDGPEMTCTTHGQNPADASDAITFLYTIILGASILIYNVPIRYFKLTILGVGGPLAIYTRVWLRFNTGLQLISGACFGFVEGAIYCYILYKVFPYENLDRWFLRKDTFLFGKDFEDTNIRPDTPTLVFDRDPLLVKAKLRSTTGASDMIMASLNADRGDSRTHSDDDDVIPVSDDVYSDAYEVEDKQFVWINHANKFC